MNPPQSEALRFGGLVYGFGLLVLGTAILIALWKAGPVARAVVQELASALREHSAALRGAGVPPERFERLEGQVGEIHARVCGPQQ